MNKYVHGPVDAIVKTFPNHDYKRNGRYFSNGKRVLIEVPVADLPKDLPKEIGVLDHAAATKFVRGESFTASSDMTFGKFTPPKATAAPFVPEPADETGEPSEDGGA